MQKIQIVNQINDRQSTGFRVSKTIGSNVVAGIVAGNREAGFVLADGDEEFIQVPNSQLSLCPYLNLQNERNCVLITGNSGKGKTLIASILLDEYHKHFPRDGVYFVSGNQKSDDSNLANLRYLQQLEIEDLKESKVEDFAESLVLIDDCDYHRNNKVIFAFLNDLVERGRKFNVSIIFISHTNSKVTSSVIYRDFDIYLTFADNLENNRVIEHTLKIPQDKIQFAKRSAVSFICVNKSFKAIVTNKYLTKY